MEDRDKTHEELVDELDALRQEVDRLKVQETAYEAQTELLRTLVSMGEKPSRSLILRSLAQQAVRLCNRLTGADEGSLFFLDEDGRVVECVLARGATIKERKESLIGRVLEKGLAGWVYKKHQVGLITDTMRDERWLQLPSQPYDVRSALCIPILRGKRLLGLITLTHPQPGHFRYEAARLMQTTATQIGLIVNVLNAYSKANGEDISTEIAQGAGEKVPTSAMQPSPSPTKQKRALPVEPGDRSEDKTEASSEDRTEVPSIAEDTQTKDLETQDLKPRAPQPQIPRTQTPRTQIPKATPARDAEPPRSPLPNSALPNIPTTQTPQSPLPSEIPLPFPRPSALPLPPKRPTEKRTIDPNSPILRDNQLSTLGLYIVTWDGKFIYANAHLARTFGYRLNEISAMATIFTLVTEAHYDFVAEKIYQCVRGQIAQLSCRFKGKRKGGQTLDIEIYGARTQFYGKAVMIGVLRGLPKVTPTPSTALPTASP